MTDRRWTPKSVFFHRATAGIGKKYSAMRLAWLLFGCAVPMILAACERQPRRVNGQAPVHAATISIQPNAFNADSDLRRRVDVVSTTHGLKTAAVMEMAMPVGSSVVVRIDEPKCLSFETVLSSSYMDPSRIRVTLHTFAHDCKNALDPELFWQALLRTAHAAEGVTNVQDGVLEFVPEKPKTVEEYNRNALANAKPGTPIEVYKVPDRRR